MTPPDPKGIKDGEFVGSPSKLLRGLRLIDERHGKKYTGNTIPGPQRQFEDDASESVFSSICSANPLISDHFVL